jgi:hypothetical protein
MASSALPSSTWQKKSDHQLGNLLSTIQNRLICYDRKKPASNDEEEETIAEFELALKDMNVTDMSEPEQALLIKKYNLCYQLLRHKKQYCASKEMKLGGYKRVVTGTAGAITLSMEQDGTEQCVYFLVRTNEMQHVNN